MLRLEACEVDDTMAQITLRVCSMQTSVPCPLCTTPAQRIHSHYERTLADLPWAAYHVRLQLRVRKWFCRNRQCPRRIFTERLPTVAAPWARRTLRLVQRLVDLGVALGGKAGVRPRQRRGPAGGRENPLPLLRRPPLPSDRLPPRLCGDDFALPQPRRPAPSGSPPSVRPGARPPMTRCGPCPARAGPCQPLPRRSATAGTPSSGICACRRGPCHSTAARMDAACSIPIKTMCSHA